ncbi:MAG: esterase-like activity of phytase family protein [Verrucomicrobiota bacterium]
MKNNLHLPLAGILATGILAAIQTTTAALPGGGRAAKILHEFTLPPFSMAYLGFDPADLAAAEANGAVTDSPGIASGLQQLNGNRYLSVTDRGANIDRPDGFKAFPFPQFSPTIVIFKVINDQIVPTDYLPILNDDGENVTGLPNGPADDGPGFEDTTTPTQLPYNHDGLDPEDIHTLPGGGFILVEEYSSSVVIVSDTGHVLKRYTPEGKPLAAVEYTPGVVTPAARYSVSDSLPGVLKQRRANRGFEGIAVSADGRTAYTVMQSPMGGTGAASPYRNSRVVRAIRMNISDPLNMQVTGQFVVYMSPVSTYPAGNFARDMKISATSWVSEDRLLFLERSDKPGSGGAKLILVDLSNATDVTGRPDAGVPLVYENVATDFVTLGITPATSEVILDVNAELPAITDFKLEGLSILNANTVSISNDNDFGIGDVPGRSSKIWQIRLGTQLR